MSRNEDILEHYDSDMMEINLRELLALFWRRKCFIVTCVLIELLAANFISDSMTRIYETSTLVMIKEAGADRLFSEQFTLFGASKNKMVHIRPYGEQDGPG